MPEKEMPPVNDAGRGIEAFKNLAQNLGSMGASKDKVTGLDASERTGLVLASVLAGLGGGGIGGAIKAYGGGAGQLRQNKKDEIDAAAKQDSAQMDKLSTAIQSIGVMGGRQRLGPQGVEGQPGKVAETYGLFGGGTEQGAPTAQFSPTQLGRGGGGGKDPWVGDFHKSISRAFGITENAKGVAIWADPADKIKAVMAMKAGDSYRQMPGFTAANSAIQDAERNYVAMKEHVKANAGQFFGDAGAQTLTDNMINDAIWTNFFADGDAAIDALPKERVVEMSTPVADIDAEALAVRKELMGY